MTAPQEPTRPSAREVIAKLITQDCDIDPYFARQTADLILDALSIRGYSVVRLPERPKLIESAKADPINRSEAWFRDGWSACLDAIEASR